MQEGYCDPSGHGKPGVESGTTLPITAAARWWARQSGTPRPHKATLIRWATRGIRGHRLRAERHGGRWFVSVAALETFHRVLNEPPPRTVDRSAGPIRVATVARVIQELDTQAGVIERQELRRAAQ